MDKNLPTDSGWNLSSFSAVNLIELEVMGVAEKASKAHSKWGRERIQTVVVNLIELEVVWATVRMSEKKFFYKILFFLKIGVNCFGHKLGGRLSHKESYLSQEENLKIMPNC